MIRWVWALGVWACLASPTLATPTVRALFVGVNHYAWTETHPADPLFKDLHGSLDDIAMVKKAFATAYGLPVDTPPATGCEAPGGVSVTLLQECATGDAIMAAFKAALDASAKDDIVLFYFAGHGAQFVDKAGVKPTRWNSSIMQSDARKNLTQARYADIMGTELAVLINAASRRGVNVVTLFDSCNSGTASRALKSSVQVRMAPPAPSGEARRVVGDPGAPGSGYIVHFGAAADGTAASEKPMDDGQVHGVFSWALAQILLRNSKAGLRTVSYQDIFDEIQRDVFTLGFPDQQPRSEGDLSQTFLGRNPISTQTVRVTAAPGGGLTLGAGSLSGVTVGSTYGLFASNTEAASVAAPTVQATVTTVSPYDALLTASASTAGDAWARELQHRVAIHSLRVQVQAPEPTRTAILNVLKTLDLVQAVEANPQFVILADATGVHFLGADGSVVGEAGDPASDQFTDKIATAVRRVAEYEAVLALRDGATGAPPSITLLANGALPDSPDPTPHVVLALGDKPSLSLTNTAPERRHLYLLDLEPDYSIGVIFPRLQGVDDAFEPNTTITLNDVVSADSLGPSQLLLLSTETPIDVAAFRQPGVPRSLGGEPNALARLLMSAKAGKRDLEGSPVSDWSASMASVNVVAAPATP
jgi:hypothetical protein